MSNTAAANTTIDSRTAPYAALILRVGLGLLFLAHGLVLKVLTFGLAGTAGYFQSIGYPAAFAYLVILGEIGGGLLLVAGVYTRWIALALLPILIGATVQHAGNGWVFNAPNGGWEFPAFWTALLLVQALLGDGAYALKVPALGGATAAGRPEAA